MAASAVVRLLADDEVAAFVTNRLYAWPLPPSGDVDGAIELLAATPAGRTFVELRTHQDAIRHCRRVWDAQLRAYFGEQRQTAAFERCAVSLGVFTALARAYHERRAVSAVLRPFLTHPWLMAYERAIPMLQGIALALVQHSPPPLSRRTTSARTGRVPLATIPTHRRPTVPENVIAALEKTPWDWSTESGRTVHAWLAEQPQWISLVAYARRGLGLAPRAAAEDVVQTALAFNLPGLLKRVEKMGDVWELSLAAVRIASRDWARRSPARSFGRASGLEKGLKLVDTPAPITNDPEEICIRRERARALWNGIQGLPLHQREVITMRLHDIEFRDIATRLGRTRSAVAASYGRAVASLAATLWEYRD